MAELARKRKLRVFIQMAVIEEDSKAFGPEKDRTWAQDMLVVPIERVEAVDANAMLERLRQNAVVIAGLADPVPD